MDRLEHSSHVCVSLQRSRRMHAFDFLCDDTELKHCSSIQGAFEQMPFFPNF